MSEGSELHRKLEQRRQRERELEALQNPSIDSGGVNCSTSRLPEQAQLPPRSSTPRRRADSIEEQIQAVAAERDALVSAHQQTEAKAMSRGIELSAEVARLRVEVEVLRKELEGTQNEMHKIRMTTHVEDKRDRQLSKQIESTGAELVEVEKRRKDLEMEVAQSNAERMALADRVKALEEEVATNVVHRVRMEALVRNSTAREAEMRRLVKEAQVAQNKACDQNEESKMFAMDDDDDDGEDGEGSETKEPDDLYGQDLEFAYEGLELSARLSLSNALRLARYGSEHDLTGVGSTIHEGDEANEEEAVDGEFQEPLKALELALATIRSGAGSGSVDGANESIDNMFTAAGTGEAMDSSPLAEFDQPLANLEDILAAMNVHLPGEETQEDDEESAVVVDNRNEIDQLSVPIIDGGQVIALPMSYSQLETDHSQSSNNEVQWLESHDTTSMAALASGVTEADAGSTPSVQQSTELVHLGGENCDDTHSNHHTGDMQEQRAGTGASPETDFGRNLFTPLAVRSGLAKGPARPDGAPPPAALATVGFGLFSPSYSLKRWSAT